ncbi:MAG: nucleoside phosphorylase [Bacteroidetes bacterium]|nr:nucleoside phosphorylase [Bacteroidota bacterium]
MWFLYFETAKVCNKPTILNKIPSSELVLNPDGSIYHLKLKPDEIADTILLVGDQGRVETISSKFDTIEVKRHNREFVTHTGTYRGKRLTALSTGIGTDNLDIVMNELDALVNINLDERIILEKKKSLRLVRIGTSGTIQADIPVDSVVVSSHGLGFDGLMHFYGYKESSGEAGLLKQINEKLRLPDNINRPYLTSADEALLNLLSKDYYTGITATASGFYAPQGRELRLKPAVHDLNERMMAFSAGGHRITNFEMETSALFGLSAMLGHQACTACAIIANRARLEYSKDYKPVIENLIISVLDRLSSND